MWASREGNTLFIFWTLAGRRHCHFLYVLFNLHHYSNVVCVRNLREVVVTYFWMARIVAQYKASCCVHWVVRVQSGDILFSYSNVFNTGLILCLRPANERRRYKVTPSLIGWAQTNNQPCNVSVLDAVKTVFYHTTFRCMVWPLYEYNECSSCVYADVTFHLCIRSWAVCWIALLLTCQHMIWLQGSIPK